MRVRNALGQLECSQIDYLGSWRPRLYHYIHRVYDKQCAVEIEYLSMYIYIYTIYVWYSIQ